MCSTINDVRSDVGGEIVFQEVTDAETKERAD